MSEEMPPVHFVDNPLAPDIFADDAVGFFLGDGIVRVAFTSNRIDHSTSPGPVNRVVVARMVMSVGSAQRLCIGLYDFLKKMGHDPLEAVGGDTSGSVQ